MNELNLQLKRSSIDISKHSIYLDEKEFLLLPGREFLVDGHLDQGSGLHLIQLKEISSFKMRLEPIILRKDEFSSLFSFCC